MQRRRLTRFLSCLIVAASQILPQGKTTAAEPASESADNAAIFADPTSDPALLAKRAYIWGFPLVEAAKIRLRVSGPASNGGRLNQFRHRRVLAGPDYRVGVGANNDTVYSLAFLDLDGGPFVLETPNFGSRYYTFSINYADSSAEQSFGQRTHGAQLPPLFIQGPGTDVPVPDDMLDVHVPTRYVNVAGRFLVHGPEDYSEVNALQDQLQLRSWGAEQSTENPPPQRPLVDPQAPLHGGLAFLEMLGNVLKDWYVDSDEVPLVQSFGAIGLSPEDGFVPAKLDAATLAAVTQGLEEGQRTVAERSLTLGVQSNGWTTNVRGPRFGRDYLLRAAVAKDQIYVAIPEEAVYPIGRTDATGAPLDGRNDYRIHIAGGKQPPVNAFWSITVYDDNGYMVPNSINRYSIGDRTPGLVRHRDGAVDILLSHTRPGKETDNWLPVPAAPFYLMMRLYVPQQPVLDGSWTPPPIEKVKP